MIKSTKSIYDAKMSILYECVENLLKHTDNTLLIDGLKRQKIKDLSFYDVDRNYSYLNADSLDLFGCSKYNKKANWKFITCPIMSCGVFYNIESNIADNKFLVGFLFRDPMFKKEDKVDFCINGKRFDTITITDLNKIYKPIHGLFYIYTRSATQLCYSLRYHDKSDYPKELIYDGVDILYIESVHYFMVRLPSEVYKFSRHDKNLYFHKEKGIICIDDNLNEVVNENYDIIEIQYPYIHYKNKIVKAYRRYKFRHEVSSFVYIRELVDIIVDYCR